ncbi:MAG TPA: serine hydrolase domain-containing protein, partial [Mycobacteriales bacterium]|nr:serine hydrolase domain-containing protein [Mycobacteriales bacterium]
HTSGIDGDKFDSFGRGDDALEQYVESCSTIGQVHPVGATWSYCNSGLNVAGRVVEVLTGKGWDESLRERVLDPIGATRTVSLPEDVVWWPFAVPHTDEDGKAVPLRRWQGDRASAPCGGLVATAGDVLRFGAMHDHDGLGTGGVRVLSEDAVTQMAVPHVTLPEGTGEDTHHGLGWAMTKLPDDRWLVGHGGDLVGTHARFVRVPAEKLAVVVLANGNKIDRIADPLLDEVLGSVGVTRPAKPTPPETTPDVDVAAKAGSFQTVAVRIELEPAGDHLEGTIRIRDAKIAEMFPESQRQSTLTLHPVTEDRWLAKMAESDDWTPAVFSESNGRRYMHMGGRAFIAS